MRHLVLPPLAIVLAATILGLSFNALRSRDGIELSRVYFAGGPAPLPAPPDAVPAPAVRRGPEIYVPPPPSPGALALAARARQEFELVDSALVQRVLAMATVDASGVALIDARDDKRFAEGHIPGAMQIDYFNVRQDIEPSLLFLQHCLRRPMIMEPQGPLPGPRFATDDWIGRPRPVLPLLLVYCESDECEDGFNLCRMLRDTYGIDRERIVLYLGGMVDWRDRKLPIARGGELW